MTGDVAAAGPRPGVASRIRQHLRPVSVKLLKVSCNVKASSIGLFQEFPREIE